MEILFIPVKTSIYPVDLDKNLNPTFHPKHFIATCEKYMCSRGNRWGCDKNST